MMKLLPVQVPCVAIPFDSLKGISGSCMVGTNDNQKYYIPTSQYYGKCEDIEKHYWIAMWLVDKGDLKNLPKERIYKHFNKN